MNKLNINNGKFKYIDGNLQEKLTRDDTLESITI